jgi:hypothetical protein
MGYRIEDGKGSRSKACVFENRLRTFAVEASLMNHVSAEVNKIPAVDPVTGVYDIRVVTPVAGSGMSLIYVANNDPDHYLNVDRIFTNASESAATLPNTSTYVSIIMGSALTAGTGTTLAVDNLNQSIVNVQPLITVLNGATTSGGVESSRRYLSSNRVYFNEPLAQKSDGIILGKGNSMEIFLSTLSSTTIEVDMRFAMIPPEDIGLKTTGTR